MGDAAIGAIIQTIVNDTYSGIKRYCNYLRYFKSNVKTLDAEAKILEAQQKDLQNKVEVANRDGLEIKAEVAEWLEKTTNILAEKADIGKDIPHVQGCCSNIKLRYSLSKRAEKAAEDMEKLRNRNNFGDDVAIPPPPTAMVPFQSEPNTLQCRTQMEDMIADALRDPDVNIVGIWGIGGTGKTFTARSVVNRMMADKLVHEAAMVVVSQEVNVLEIQQKIADLVGLELRSKIELAARANQLRTRLKSPGSKIIVVDDIWEKLDFKEIGIPCGSDSSGCKILVTSRNKQLLIQIEAQVFGMDTLTEKDAWSLFRDKAGACVDNANLKPTAEQVLDECQGLPLAIVTVGSALKNQLQIGIWEHALNQLKRAAPANIEGVLKDVYKPLRLSYDRLATGDQKSLFLLCCIFPEDFEISLEDLALYSMGLNRFEGVCSLLEARNRVLALVDKLKGCALLLDGEDEHHAKMHDVVRDVARFIAREEEKLIDVQLGLKWAFIRWSVEDSNYKIGSNFQYLRLLIISKDGYMNTNDFPTVGGMQELEVLEVLSLRYISWELIDCRLKNLKTLELIHCALKNLSFVGELMGLEILKCNSCNEVEELPIEIGKLKRLKLLDLSDCRCLTRIRAGIISKLNDLEELMMLNSFDQWESTKIINEKEVERNACLKELESLKKLTCLKIEIANIELLEENMNLSESIIKYQIQIGNHKFIHEDKDVSSYPHLFTEHNDCFGSWIHKFVSAAKTLYLDGDWSKCEEMEEVFLLEKKEHVGKKNSLTFSNLVKMEIHKMPNLTAFGKGIESIEFPLLTELYLRDCPKFKWIDPHDDCNRDEDSLHYFCNKKVTFGILQNLEIQKYDARSLWCQQIPLQFFGALEKLTIWACPNIKSFCSFSIATNFINLKQLTIIGCEDMECVIEVEKPTHHNSTRSGKIQPFPKLESLYFWSLQKLKTLSEGIETFELHMLHSLAIDNCPKFIGSNQNQTNGCNMDDNSLHLFCSKQKEERRKKEEEEEEEEERRRAGPSYQQEEEEAQFRVQPPILKKKKKKKLKFQFRVQPSILKKKKKKKKLKFQFGVQPPILKKKKLKFQFRVQPSILKKKEKKKKLKLHIRVQPHIEGTN